VSGEFTLEPLGPTHERKLFSCGIPALDRYLHELATRDIRRRISNCFVALDPAEDRRWAAAELRRSAPELIVFSSGVSPAVNYSFFQEVEAAKLRYLVIEHLVRPSLFGFEARLRARFSHFYQAATAVVSVSEHNLRTLRQCLALPDRVGKVIRNGRPEIFFRARDEDVRRGLREEWKVPQNALIALTVASLEPQKGHQILVEGMRRLKAAGAWERLFFVWIGDGSLRSQLEEALDRYGIAGHVRLLGYQWEVAPLYDGADVMVLTSLSEGMPLAVMEAMAKGLPPICTDVGGTAEAIADAGIVLPAPAPDGRTAAELTTALERLSADNAARDRLASRARQRAAALFRQDRMIEEYLDLIAHGLASRPSTEPFVAQLVS
jgi:glycosyltransferase involved in cell wall biosynthesis